MLLEALTLGLISALAASLYGVAALWAVSGRGAWFWRWAPLTLLLAALAPLGAYELLAMFGTQVGVVIGVLFCRRLFRRNAASPAPGELRPQFSMVDLFRAMLIAGLVFALVRNRAPSTEVTGILIHWSAWIFAGATLGVTTLVTAWLFNAASGWRVVAAILFLLTLLNPVVALAWRISRFTFSTNDVNPPWLFWGQTIAVMHPLVILAWLALLIAAGVWRTKVRDKQGVRSGASERAWRALLVGLSLASLVFLAFLYQLLLGPTAPSTIKLPDPNGFDELLQTANALNWTAIPSTAYEAAPEQSLRDFIAENREQFSRLRLAIEMPSRVPILQSGDYLTTALTNPTSIRNLSRAISAEARLAELEGRHSDAARSYLDIVRVGQKTSHGGLIIDELMSIAITSVGLQGIIDISDKLTPADLTQIGNELERIATSLEPGDVFTKRDHAWSDYCLGWQWRLWSWLGDSEFDADKQAGKARLRYDARMRLLFTELAIRRHILAAGKPPETLADLVPKYLTEIPQDSYRAGPLVYRRTDDGYLLYSVGGNGVDDGGQRVLQYEATTLGLGDLFFDAGAGLPSAPMSPADAPDEAAQEPQP